MAYSFDDYIKQTTNDSPSTVYTFPTASGPLTILNSDIETFKQLYQIHPSKAIGFGEVSLKWLFSPNSTTNHGGSNADLIIQENKCEVKSYNNHFNKMPLGRFKEDKESRFILNNIFSFYNVTQDNKKFISETNFNIEDLKNSYEVLLNTSKSVFYNREIPYLSKIYDKSLEILAAVTGSSTEELSKNLMVKIISTKLHKKPGHDGYVINLIPTNPCDIYVYKIDLDKLQHLSYDDLKDNIGVASGTIELNYKIFL